MGSQAFLEGGLAGKRNLKPGVGAGPFLERAAAETREPVKKGAGSPTLIDIHHL